MRRLRRHACRPMPPAVLVPLPRPTPAQVDAARAWIGGHDDPGAFLNGELSDCLTRLGMYRDRQVRQAVAVEVAALVVAARQEVAA